MGNRTRSDHAIQRLKIEAIAEAINAAFDAANGDPDFVSVRNLPRKMASGDFFWVRTFESVVLVIIGDTIGHDRYAALLRTAVGMCFNDLCAGGRGRTSGGRPVTSAHALLVGLWQRFSGLMKLADGVLKENGHEDVDLLTDSFDVALCVIGLRKIEFAGAGLPVFVATSTGEVRRVGKYSSDSLNATGRSVRSIRPSSDFSSDSRFLIFATDGVVNQRNREDESNSEFGEDRLRKTIESALADPGSKRGTQAVVDAVVAATEEHRGKKRKATDDRLVVGLDVARCRQVLKKRISAVSGRGRRA